MSSTRTLRNLTARGMEIVVRTEPTSSVDLDDSTTLAQIGKLSTPYRAKRGANVLDFQWRELYAARLTTVSTDPQGRHANLENFNA